MLKPLDLVFVVRSCPDGKSSWFFGREHNAFLYRQMKFASSKHIANNLDMYTSFGEICSCVSRGSISIASAYLWHSCSSYIYELCDIKLDNIRKEYPQFMKLTMLKFIIVHGKFTIQYICQKTARCVLYTNFMICRAL